MYIFWHVSIHGVASRRLTSQVLAHFVRIVCRRPNARNLPGTGIEQLERINRTLDEFSVRILEALVSKELNMLKDLGPLPENINAEAETHVFSALEDHILDNGSIRGIEQVRLCLLTILRSLHHFI